MGTKNISKHCQNSWLINLKKSLTPKKDAKPPKGRGRKRREKNTVAIGLTETLTRATGETWGGGRHA